MVVSTAVKTNRDKPDEPQSITFLFVGQTRAQFHRSHWLISRCFWKSSSAFGWIVQPQSQVLTTFARANNENINRMKVAPLPARRSSSRRRRWGRRGRHGTQEKSKQAKQTVNKKTVELIKARWCIFENQFQRSVGTITSSRNLVVNFRIRPCHIKGTQA